MTTASKPGSTKRAIQAETSATLWVVQSRLPQRLRVNSRELMNSAILRHHCNITLTCCHWLQNFRINSLTGSLILHFPRHRQRDVEVLLKLALQIPTIDNEMVSPLGELRAARWQANEAGRLAARHGTAIGALLIIETLLPMPLAVITAAAILSLIPLLKEMKSNLQHKESSNHSILDLAFSGLLISQGLPGEALLDQLFGDATQTIKGVVSGEEEFHAESRESIDRLGEHIKLDLAKSKYNTRKLSEINRGDRYYIALQSHIFLPSRVIKGDFIVINRLYDGDWKPLHLKTGDIVHAGSFVVKGSGLLEVMKSLKECSNYHIPQRHERSKLDKVQIEQSIDTYYQWMTPVLLAAGGASAALGAIERALGFLQFTPVHSWETSSISARLTAMATLQLHGIHLNDPEALIAMGKVKHVVISRSCLDRMGGIKTHEHINPSSGAQKGDILKILAGIQDFLLENDDVPIWSDQLHHVHAPTEVVDVEINDLLTEGWRITLADGRILLMSEMRQAASDIHQRHLNPLQIWENDTFLGYADLITEPGPGWSAVCETLEELGLEVHVVGVDNNAKMMELVKPLRINHESHLHGNFHAEERMNFVRSLQEEGEGVAYVGYVLSDMPALSQADVSIVIEVDADSIFSSSICDVVIGPDVHWLPRMISLSRRLQNVTNSNFQLLVGSALVTAIGSAVNWLSPLATVVFSNVPIVLAGVRNITAMNTHSLFEVTEHNHKTDFSHPSRPLACRVPQRLPTIPSRPPKDAGKEKTNSATYGRSRTAAASRRRGSATP
jgi:cation transport ATPase